MDGSTSVIHDTIEALRDTSDIEIPDEVVIEALALFIERSGLGNQAKAFITQYFDGTVPKRTP